MAIDQLDWKSDKNEVLLNPRWPIEVRDDFHTQLKKWLDKNSRTKCVLLSTSGTTAKDLRETKIVLLTKEAFLHSAESVGKNFEFSPRDRVAQTLPRFHVGGLSQEARSWIWGQKIFPFLEKWKGKTFHKFLQENRITHTSLVPTQLYDLLMLGERAPPHLQKIFIGGGALGVNLAVMAESLGYQITLTYGMTETASMIAYQDPKLPFQDGFRCLPHCQIQISEQGLLRIRSSSLFEGYLRIGRVVEFESSAIESGWFQSEDLATATENGFVVLGRSQEYAKVGGEGVYLGRLQRLFSDSCLEQKMPQLQSAILCFVEDPRLGHAVHMFSEIPLEGVQEVIREFNEKVLPFERIRGFHHVSEIPVSDLGKVRWQDLMKSPPNILFE